MRKIIHFLVLLIVILFTVSFALLNDQNITVNYYFGELDLPLTVLIFAVLLAGWLLGLLSFLKYIVGLKLDAREANRAAMLAEKEVKNLRKLPLSDEY